MKILTYNVRSWYRDIQPGPRNWKERADRIRALIAREAPDIVLLQEAIFPMTARCIPDGYDKVSGCSISHHIFVRRGFAEVISHEWHIHWTRALLRLPNASRWQIVSVHGHWDEGKTARLAEDLKGIDRKGCALLIGGDWNNEPATMRPQLFPLMVRSLAGGTTFKNWESGKRADLDYFAGESISGGSVRLAVPCSFQDSDHLPVVIELP